MIRIRPIAVQKRIRPFLMIASVTTITPSAPPTGTTSMNVSTDTSFDGTFATNPMTGVVAVTDAHPAGVYTVTVRAFGPGGIATQTFMLTVTNGTACTGTSGFTNAVDAVERSHTDLGKCEARAGYEVFYGARDENVAHGGFAGDLFGEFDREEKPLLPVRQASPHIDGQSPQKIIFRSPLILVFKPTHYRFYPPFVNLTNS